jgi:hypothetical protein
MDDTGRMEIGASGSIVALAIHTVAAYLPWMI